MAGYPDIQTAVFDVILKLTNYTTANLSQYDLRILGVGNQRNIILRRGNSGTSQSGQQDIIGGNNRRYVRRDDWVVRIELYVPIIESVLEARSNIGADMQEILDHMDTWPALDQTSGVLGTGADTPAEPEEWIVGDTRYFRQVMELTVEEHAEVLVNETVHGLIFRYGASGSLYGTAVYA